MSKILVAVTRNFGFVPTMARLSATLLERGHRLVVLTAPDVADRFAPLGVEVVAVDEPPMPEAPRFLPPLLARARQGYLRADQVLLGPMSAQWDAVQLLLRRDRFDLVLADGFHVGAGLLGHLPRSARPPLIKLGHFPIVPPDPQVPPYGLGILPDSAATATVRTALLELAATRSYAALSRRYRDRVRRLTGVVVPGDVRTALACCDVWAQLSVPRFEYPRSALPAGFRFIGALPAPPSGPPPAWFDPAAPLLVVLPDGAQEPEALVDPAVEAFAGTRTAVLVVGTDPGRGAGLPANVHLEREVPWTSLRPRSTAVLTAGDFIAVHHGLRHGIPVITAGTIETQVETAARVRWVDAGIDLRTSRPTAAAVRAAVERTMEDPALRQGAARIAAQLARADAEATLLELVDELVGLGAG